METDVLQQKYVHIFKKLGCNIPSKCIEACHRVSKKSATVIVKFSGRKDCQQVLTVKKDLRKIKMEDLTYHVKINFLQIRTCVYVVKYYDLKVKSYIF